MVQALMAKETNFFTLPHLGKEKYENWSIQMRVLLESQELWDSVDMGYVEYSREEEAELKMHKKQRFVERERRIDGHCC
ncbi:hypothetical protein RHGRI_006894 [Rhododendron griersonianum]|uniref:DUF4219 domain-containing protein n=1 Tax=Rhododendron griersonianum TaxID=479676 RepID=A0AAV6KV36_9ERIC|nr:hypothetical protein RHGRI_006894 [Rhododendron griersonianum]